MESLDSDKWILSFVVITTSFKYKFLIDNEDRNIDIAWKCKNKGMFLDLFVHFPIFEIQGLNPNPT